MWRWWRRPVQPLHLVAVALATLALWVATMATVLVHLRESWAVQVALRDQPFTATLPAGLLARASITDTLETSINERFALTVPFEQTVQAQVPDALRATTHVETEVDVDTRVRFEADVPVDTEVTLQVPMVSWLPALTVKAPVRLTVPVRVDAPVHAVLPLRLDVALDARLPQALAVPVRARFEAVAHARGAIRAQVLNDIDFKVEKAIPGLALRLIKADVQANLGAVEGVRSPPP